MARILETLTLATLVTVTLAVTACDSPDRDVDDAAPRDEVLRTDAASLEALAESESEILDAMAAQLGIDSDELLDMALDPAASSGLDLTAPPSPTKSGTCVGLGDIIDFCYQPTSSGVWVWVEAFGIESAHDYLGTNGACDSGGLGTWPATVSYTYCYWEIPVRQVYIGAEACWDDDCDGFFYAKFF